MKKIASKTFCEHAVAVVASMLLTTTAMAQNLTANTTSSKTGFGFRAGFNYAKVTGNSDSIKYQYKPGLMVAVFLNPHYTGVIGSRHEILYSRQGFQYTDPKGNSGTVSNDYIMLPQMMTINITKFVQLQIGAFAGYLLRSKDSNDSNDSPGTSSSPGYASYLNLMNRIDYGAAGGIEIHPFKGLVLNARYNMGFAKMYKKEDNPGSVTYTPSSYFMPYQNIDSKNALLQFSLGYVF